MNFNWSRTKKTFQIVRVIQKIGERIQKKYFSLPLCAPKIFVSLYNQYVNPILFSSKKTEMNDSRKPVNQKEKPTITSIEIQPMTRFGPRISRQQQEQFQRVVVRADTIRGSFLPSSETAVHPEKMWKLVGLMMIICISPFYVGSSIFLSASASFSVYKQYYKIPLGQILSFSMINGAVPLGGIVGSMTLPYVMKHTNKRDIAFIHFGASLVFCGITLIPYFEALMVGRFLLGIICSWENSIGATLIRDFTPINYRTLFGAFYFTARASGITFIFLVGLFFDYEPDTLAFCLINMIPVYLTVIQLILLKIFAPMSPGDLIAKNKLDELRDFFGTLYAKQVVEIAVNNCLRQFKASTKVFAYVHANRSEQEKSQANVKFSKLQNRAMFVSLQTSLLRQFCGVNYLTLYTTDVLRNLKFDHYKAGPVLINIVQIAATLVSLYLCHRYKRRPLMILGIFGVFVGSLTVAFCDLYQLYAGVIVGQIIFMIFIGSMVSPIAWPYPPQIIPPLQVKFTSLVSWSGSTIVAIIPIMEKSAPFFFAVSGYLLFSEFVAYFMMIETKGQTLREVMTNLMKKAYGTPNRP